MNTLKEFCKERMINPKIEEAFTAYVKASYSTSFAVKPGETLSKIINNMTREKVDEMWLQFVNDFKSILVTE